MAKRNAVVVTHTRLRQTGTVVAEAVSQLRVAGFEVTIIDNTEAPDFGLETAYATDAHQILSPLNAARGCLDAPYPHPACRQRQRAPRRARPRA